MTGCFALNELLISQSAELLGASASKRRAEILSRQAYEDRMKRIDERQVSE
jgi:hypothetical protein